MMKGIKVFTLGAYVMATLLISCTNDNDEDLTAENERIFEERGIKILTDAKLLDIIQEVEGFNFYKGKSSIFRATSEGTQVHGPFITIRYNDKAASVFDASGNLPTNAVFPDSSLIVKDIYNTDNANDRKFWAVMMKLPDDPNQVDGWVWAEYRADESAVARLSGKGSLCVSCHNRGGNIDKTRAFSSF